MNELSWKKESNNYYGFYYYLCYGFPYHFNESDGIDSLLHLINDLGQFSSWMKCQLLLINKDIWIEPVFWLIPR